MVSGLAIALVLAGADRAAAQSTGQTSQELELPDTEERPSDRANIRVERDAGLRANCPFDESDLTVSLDGVQFVDVRGGELAPELAQTLARVETPVGERQLSVICDVRDAANAALRRDGWIATVQVPQQELSGTLRLDVISARISEIRITGDAGPYRDALVQAIEPLRQLDPLNEREAERILLNANDMPGLEVRLALAPSGETPGEVIGNLSVDFERFAAYFNVRNSNARSIGRETAFGRFEYYGLTGLSDITYVAAQTTADFDEQIIVQGGHEFGIGRDNIRVGVDVVFASARPSIENLDLETETLVGNLSVSYPLIRTPATAADVTLGFDYIEQETSVGPVPLSKDSIRTVFVRAEMDGQRRRIDRSTSLLYSGFLEVRQGIGVFGATSRNQFGTAITDGLTASRPFGDAQALVFRGGADVTWFPGSIFDLRGRVEGQWTDEPLLNFDEYAIGNLSIGRGYDPGANSGDRAIGGLAELGATVLESARHRLQLFGFFDIVQVENLDRGTPDPRRTLKSVGGGLRFSLGAALNAEVVYAKPLDRPLFSDTERPPDRVLFSLTTKFPALFR
ncbi:ShlB/FhaC/HecB family hemolysin secretion/activation protein [Erythrobacter sp. JK5]|uniref:ShlB/FhaC/HecB family hemolysin secretion/activation protein n=1 Tax=Erythrobacter sp. JK5 TaxID=2829500 RepID=UPI001BA6F0E0|nr:ShlB/FhaC/HecB family hemolysin secretion/activation protein [Erythrobacter sp. JK5]QUL36793.1 ShlB/FhaC/HecB family hemolysin secretion/activation protein [Erythrobacter sp. JK5]